MRRGERRRRRREGLRGPADRKGGFMQADRWGSCAVLSRTINDPVGMGSSAVLRHSHSTGWAMHCPTSRALH